MRKKCPSLGRYPIVYCHCQAHAPAYPPGFICIAYSNSWRIHPKPAAVTLQMLLCPVPFFNFSIDCVVIFTVLLYKYKCAILATSSIFHHCFRYSVGLMSSTFPLALWSSSAALFPTIFMLLPLSHSIILLCCLLPTTERCAKYRAATVQGHIYPCTALF